ncbi:MAG: hypothetical protein KGI10_01640 [Thaumarchaeota archaeon]|nr:hypothetical protein [Nitrososphaerota archaeon]
MATNEGRTSFAINHRLLLCCLFSLAFIGTTYYYIDNRKQAYEIQWIVISIAWYSAICFSITKVLYKARIGYLLAGIVSWATLAFLILDNYDVVFQTTITTKQDDIITIRNLILAGIVSLGILSSHNAFHKFNHVQNKAKFT